MSDHADMTDPQFEEATTHGLTTKTLGGSGGEWDAVPSSPIHD